MSSKWTESEKRPIKTDMGGLYEDTLHNNYDWEKNWERKRQETRIETLSGDNSAKIVRREKKTTT